MDRLVAFAVNRRFLMVGLFAAILVGGSVAFQQLNIEAYPDPTPPMVDIVTQSAGLSAEEIERYITIPLEAQVAGIKNLNVIRTISLYGLSDVKLQFSFDYTYDQAQQQVLNRLSQLAPLLNNAQPQISPLSPIGEIYRYRLVCPSNYSVLDLKTLQDWVLQRRFRVVPGIQVAFTPSCPAPSDSSPFCRTVTARRTSAWVSPPTWRHASRAPTMAAERYRQTTAPGNSMSSSSSEMNRRLSASESIDRVRARPSCRRARGPSACRCQNCGNAVERSPAETVR